MEGLLQLLLPLLLEQLVLQLDLEEFSKILSIINVSIFESLRKTVRLYDLVLDHVPEVVDGVVLDRMLVRARLHLVLNQIFNSCERFNDIVRREWFLNIRVKTRGHLLYKLVC